MLLSTNIANLKQVYYTSILFKWFKYLKSNVLKDCSKENQFIAFCVQEWKTYVNKMPSEQNVWYLKVI